MLKYSSLSRFLLRTIFLFVCVSSLYAETRLDAPDSLEQWRSWVLWKNNTIECPFITAGHTQTLANKQCAWPGKLSLDITNKRAIFSQYWKLYGRANIILPGDKEHWPNHIQVNGKKGLLLELEGRPMLRLDAGEYELEGTIPFADQVQALSIPAYTGMLKLTQNGNAVRDIAFDKQGKILLSQTSKKPQKKTRDSLAVQVFRKLSDGYPMVLESHVVLDVSGRERLVSLGRALPADFIPVSFISPLPARINDQGNLDVQLRPGRWTIKFSSRMNFGEGSNKTDIENSFSMLKQTPGWPEQELWAFQPARQYRVVSLTGAPTIDPSQTAMPEHWSQYASYILAEDKALVLKEKIRGLVKKQKHELVLKRDMWLGFDGNNMITREELTGYFKHLDRVQIQSDYQPGNVAINGKPQLITSVNGDKGIEVRPGSLTMTSVGQVTPGVLNINPWQLDVDKAEINLHLPPGYRLFYAGGVDRVSHAYLTSWNLWDIFISTIFIVMLVRVFHWQAGIVGLSYVLLTHKIPGAPEVLWLLVLLGCYSATRYLSEGRLYKVMRVSYMGVGALLILSFLGFSVDQARQTFYPQLEKPWASITYSNTSVSTASIVNETKDNNLEDEMAATLANPAVDSLTSSYSKRAVAKVKNIPNHSEYDYQAYDPGTIIQTGPGVPSWNWNKVRMSWGGMVTKEQKISLWLMPPWLNRVLNIARILAFLALALLFVKFEFKRVKNTTTLKSVLVLSVLFSLSTADQSYASSVKESGLWPDVALLQEYERRLLAPPSCFPHCISINEMRVKTTKDKINLVFSVAAASVIAFPLPLNQNHIGAISLSTQDGKVLPLRMIANKIYTLIPEGDNRLLLSIDVEVVNEINFPFSLMPHRVIVEQADDSAAGWKVLGVRAQKLLSNTLSFKRVENSRLNVNAPNDTPFGQTAIKQRPTPIFVQVERQLDIDHDWRVTTRVLRVSPKHGPLNIKVPLLAGESIISNNIKAEDGEVVVSLAERQAMVQWKSILKPTNRIILKAYPDVDRVERWTVNPSLRWHMNYEGIAPIHSASFDSSPLQWWPRANESLILHITKPEAVAGKGFTIESVKLNYNPGKRASQADLKFSARTSQGFDYRLPLPDQVEVNEVLINDRRSLVSEEDGELILPLQPGHNQLSISLKQHSGYGLKTSSPHIEIRDASNVHINLNLPRERWVLWVSGPVMGPAVLFWGLLLVITLVAFILGSQPWSVLKSWQWLLLGVGVTTTFMPLLIVILSWFVLLSFRTKILALPATQERGAKAFNFIQVIIGLNTLAMLLSLLASVSLGLVFEVPNMQVMGNGSSDFYLSWYQDISENSLPSVSVISVPMLVYRLLILAWSIWLSLSLMGWLRWGWESFSEGGVWKKNAKKLDGKSESGQP